ncbi:hypothetical protein B4168_2590 [Anoxybacillus flavithermus]|nr:hypothetical protein B4168_2590 [Anoxybacillus flavithermus]
MNQTGATKQIVVGLYLTYEELKLANGESYVVIDVVCILPMRN